MNYDEILRQEYDESFDNIRKKMMVMSYYKYGPAKDNYKLDRTMKAIGSLEMRLQKYKDTGNLEFLADIANFAMLEFMYPQHPKAHYQPTDSDVCGVDGMGINQIKELSL